jgi:hypothetical protein
MQTSVTAYSRTTENQELVWSELVSTQDQAQQLAERWRHAKLPAGVSEEGRGRRLTVKWGSRDAKFAGRRFTVWIVVAFIQHKSVGCESCGRGISWLKRELGGHRCRPEHVEEHRKNMAALTSKPPGYPTEVKPDDRFVDPPIPFDEDSKVDQAALDGDHT